MLNSKIVSKYLQKAGSYPPISEQNSDGLKIALSDGQLIISGDPSDLIGVADLLVSLALSGKNNGQHWHLDQSTLISGNSPIGELVLERND